MRGELCRKGVDKKYLCRKGVDKKYHRIEESRRGKGGRDKVEA